MGLCAALRGNLRQGAIYASQMSITCQRVNACRSKCQRAYLEQHAMRVVLPVRGEERLFHKGVEWLGECLLHEAQQGSRVPHGLIEALAVDERLIEHAEQGLQVRVQQHEGIDLQVRGQDEFFGARIVLIQPELGANLQICLGDRIHLTEQQDS